MGNWELKDGEVFISDIGNKCDTIGKQKSEYTFRYAVIKNRKQLGQFQIIEVGNDLQKLLNKYGLCPNNVGRVKL